MSEESEIKVPMPAVVERLGLLPGHKWLPEHGCVHVPITKRVVSGVIDAINDFAEKISDLDSDVEQLLHEPALKVVVNVCDSSIKQELTAIQEKLSCLENAAEVSCSVEGFLSEIAGQDATRRTTVIVLHSSGTYTKFRVDSCPSLGITLDNQLKHYVSPGDTLVPQEGRYLELCVCSKLLELYKTEGTDFYVDDVPDAAFT